MKDIKKWGIVVILNAQEKSILYYARKWSKQVILGPKISIFDDIFIYVH